MHKWWLNCLLDKCYWMIIGFSWFVYWVVLLYLNCPLGEWIHAELSNDCLECCCSGSSWFICKSTFTAVLNLFFHTVCVISVEALDFLITHAIFISFVSYSINFLPQKGTPLMFNLNTYQFPVYSLPCRHDKSLTLLHA